MDSRLENILSSRLLWPVAGLVLLLGFNLVTNPGFLAIEVKDGRLFGSLIDVFNRGSIVVILALGMTLVIATGGVDLSVGAVMAIAGSSAALLMERLGLSMPAAVAVTLLISVGVGVGNGLLVSYGGIQPIIATLILMVAGRGIATYLVEEKSINISRESFEVLGRGTLFGLPVPVWIMVGLFVVTLLVVRGTAMGLMLEAIGDNETAGRFSGIATRPLGLLAYGFCAGCAGLAGLVETSNVMVADPKEIGWMAELYAIFAVVVGGTALTGGRFSLTGALIGALLLQLLWTTMFSTGVPSDTAPMPMAIIILVVCLFQSESFRSKAKRMVFRRAR